MTSTDPFLPVHQQDSINSEISTVIPKVTSKDSDAYVDSDEESTFSLSRKRRRKSKKLSKRDFIEHMHLTQPEAAKALDVCLTTFKNQFAKFPLRWPTPSERKQLIKEKKKQNITQNSYTQLIKNMNIQLPPTDTEKPSEEQIEQKIIDLHRDMENQRRKNDLLRRLINHQTSILQELKQPQQNQSLHASYSDSPIYDSHSSALHNVDPRMSFQVNSGNSNIISYPQQFLSSNCSTPISTGIHVGISQMHNLGQNVPHNQGMSSLSPPTSHSLHQGMNHGMNHSLNQNMSQGMNQSMNQNINQGMPSMNQGINQAINQGLNQTMNQGIPQNLHLGFHHQNLHLPINNQFLFPPYPVMNQPMNSDI